mgnify:CR=1 FL=1
MGKKKQQQRQRKDWVLAPELYPCELSENASEILQVTSEYVTKQLDGEKMTELEVIEAFEDGWILEDEEWAAAAGSKEALLQRLHQNLNTQSYCWALRLIRLKPTSNGWKISAQYLLVTKLLGLRELV